MAIKELDLHQGLQQPELYRLSEIDKQTSDEQIVAMFLMKYHHSYYTYRNYNRAINQFRRFIAFKPLREVTWREFEGYKITLEKGLRCNSHKPLAPATVAGLVDPIRSLYKWGGDPNIGFFTHNPTTTVHTTKVPITSKNNYPYARLNFF
ncbi:hypothetical protein [Aneurinibacillus tyrosinisolvens]|uniref:hypothetical protein n=1 Tax=Aneurinibacillus tyrosinisolvens TaxID=1443435 RepID=UPI000A770EBB